MLSVFDPIMFYLNIKGFNFIFKEKFSLHLNSLSAMLEEGQRCLEHDRENSMEREVGNNIIKMKDTVKDFRNFINFM